MKTLGRYFDSYRGENDALIISFEVENDDFVENFKDKTDKEYFIEVEDYQPKRSLQANRYLWKLCDLIGQKLHLTKDVVYLMKLADYGVFCDVSVRKDAINDTFLQLKAHFRYVQEIAEHGNYKDIRCYIGSSLYNKKEMQKLLQGVVQDAQDLGIDTWNKEEIDMMIKAWKG